MLIATTMIRRSKRLLFGSSSDVLFVSGGTAAGQVVAMIAAPLIARNYSPADFGIFASCSAIIVTLGTVATLRFEMAICLPESEEDAQGLATLGVISACLLSASAALILLLVGSNVAGLLGQPSLMPWLWFVPGSVMAMSSYLIFNQLAIRHNKFRLVGRRNLIQQAVTVVGQVGLGVASIRPGGLLIGLGLGQFVGAVSLLPGSGLFGADAKAGRHLTALKALARRYRRFPLVLGPSGLLNALGMQMPLLLVAFWFGSATAGWLGLTQRLLALPVALIGTAVGQVYLARFAVALRSNPAVAMTLFRRASVRLGICALTLMVVVMLLGPWAFALIFGSGWTNSGLYAQALSIGSAFQLVAAPLSVTLVALERQQTQLLWDLGRLASVFIAVGGAWVLGGSALQTIWALGMALATTYCASWVLSMSSIRRRVQDHVPTGIVTPT